MKDIRNPYKILSIIGYDRSGTTFLGKYLNCYSDVIYIGELDRGIQKIKDGEDWKCTCGLSINDCKIWSKIKKHITENETFYIKDIYDLIQSLTYAKIVIDSSKGFTQIKNIASTFHRDHLILWIIRNPKGVVYSRMKTRRRRVTNKNHPKPYIAKMYNLMLIFDSIEWCLENLWIKKFLRKRDAYFKLEYESLDNSVKNEVLPLLFNHGIESKIYSSNESHIIFGNISRYQSVSSIIAIDKQWVYGLNKLQKILVDIITFPTRFLLNF